MSSTYEPDEFDWIRLFWTDLNGVARGINLPASEFDHARAEGVGFANGVVEFTLEPGFLSETKYGPESGDMMAVPDTDSLVPVEWQNGAGAAFGSLTTVNGEALDLCSRSALERVVADLESEGYTPMAGVETEFSLLKPDGDGGYEPFNTRSSYDMTGLDQATDLMSAWSSAMETAGYDVVGCHQESQPGQFEVNVRYDDALTTADGITFFRHMVKALASRRDLKASLMPRPYTGEDANGMHFHLSLWDEDESENLFASDTGDLRFPAGKLPAGESGLSDDARYFVGGLLDHMKALTAVCAPTVNSYKRLVPGIWAPTSIAWGPDNRSTVLRIPPELGAATRIEHRVPDTSSNPYLAMAATLAAGLDGIRNETDPGEPTIENAHDQDYERLPRTLWDALNHLEADEALQEALGGSLVTEFLTLKRDEFDRYQNNVTDWERDRYREPF